MKLFNKFTILKKNLIDIDYLNKKKFVEKKNVNSIQLKSIAKFIVINRKIFWN